MADLQNRGKKNRKLGRNKTKCERYRMAHGGGTKKKIVGSKGHRGCGPLGYYMRARAEMDRKYGPYRLLQDKGDTFNARVKVK